MPPAYRLVCRALAEALEKSVVAAASCAGVSVLHDRLARRTPLLGRAVVEPAPVDADLQL
ncbi:hypothetical protein QP185_20090 [Sphingomonas aerolata]|uniref:hypothetical protein n=1 Tax=Sphingomonas aerolata TaxID=185951 RepID=UPI002FE01DB5